MSKVVWGSYEDLASEYYDPLWHPTSANFREASALLLSGWLEELTIGNGWLAEVGPGKSLIAELTVKQRIPLNKLILIDSSPTMLKYSKNWAQLGAHPVLGDALTLPLPSESIDLLVSSLGDPYNEPSFWEEVSRVLRVDGVCLFTTPSYDWAVTFRSRYEDNTIMSAIFELSDGRRVGVPSWIYPVDEQLRLISGNGLKTKHIECVPLYALKSACLSPKLLLERGPMGGVVTGYFVTKPVHG